MINKNLIVTVLLSITLSCIASYFIVSLNKPKFAFVDTKKVFSEFQLKKDLEKKLSEETKKRSKEIDSLKIDLQTKYQEALKNKNQLVVQNFNFSESMFYKKENSFKEDIQTISDEYTQQTWKQLNQLMKEYGKETGTSYIFGTKGEGDLLYAPESEDITLEVIKFINKKYQGG